MLKIVKKEIIYFQNKNINKYKMSDEWYRFNCICPGCGGGMPTDWYHSQKSCISTNGWLYINSECKIKCDECYNEKKKDPSFVLGWKFECENHKGEYKKVDEMAICQAISYICTNNKIPRDVRKQMINMVNNTNY